MIDLLFGVMVGGLAAGSFVRARLAAGQPVLGALRTVQFWLAMAVTLMVAVGVDAVVH